MMVRSRRSRRSVAIQRSANVRVPYGCSYRRLEDLEALAAEHLVEGVDEPATPVSNERRRRIELVAVAEEQVPGCLGGPRSGGVFGDAAEMDGAGGDVDEEQQVEARHGDGVDGGEVTRHAGSPFGCAVLLTNA